MSMLGVMRGDGIVGAFFCRLRRQVHSGVVDTDSTPDVQIITPPVDFFSKHRSCKSHIPFSSLDVNNRKDFYGRAAEYHIDNVGGEVTYTFATKQVARHFGLPPRSSAASTSRLFSIPP
jgi:hypothetical protein